MGGISRASITLRSGVIFLRSISRTRLADFLCAIICLSGALAYWALSTRARAGESYDTVIQGVAIRIPEVPQIPKDWSEDPYRCQVTRLRPALREKALHQVEATLQKYPPRVLSQCLDTVVLVDRLKSRDLNPGGGYWDRTLLLVAGDRAEDSYAAEMSRTIHHEISSLLMSHFADRVPTEQWVRNNPPNFQYRLGQIVRPEDNTEVTEKDAKDGFACSYGRMDMENDFNTIVENLCLPADGFLVFLRNYPPLRAKALLTIRFYKEIDSELVALFDPGILGELSVAYRNGN